MFLLRSNNRVKYLHGSFIRKMCASNSRSFQWVALYELDSVKISSGFQAAVIVQGSSAAWALVPALAWCCFSWHQSVRRVCVPGQPLSRLMQQVSSGENIVLGGKTTKVMQDRCIQTKVSRKRSPVSWVASLPLWWYRTAKSFSNWSGERQGVRSTQILKSTKFVWAAGDMARESVSLSASLDLSHGKEYCSASIANDLTASTRTRTSFSLSPCNRFFSCFWTRNFWPEIFFVSV